MAVTRRSSDQIAADNATQARKVFDKAEERVQKAREELEKAQAALPAARRKLDYILDHPDLPEDVRVALTPEVAQTAIPEPSEPSDGSVPTPTDVPN